MSTELLVATRHRRNMTEKMLKATLNSNTHTLNIFKLLFLKKKSAWPIEAKFHVKLQWDGGTEVCSNSLVHMTKMVAMPIYSKHVKKSSALEPKDR